MTDEKVWKKLEQISEDVILLRIEVAKLKLKASSWGLLSGIIGSIGIYLISTIKG